MRLKLVSLQKGWRGNRRKARPTTFAPLFSFLVPRCAVLEPDFDLVVAKLQPSGHFLPLQTSQIGAVVELLLQPQQLMVGEKRPSPSDGEPVLAWCRRSKEKGTVRSAAVCLTTLSGSTSNVRAAPFNNPQPISPGPSKGPELSA